MGQINKTDRAAVRWLCQNGGVLLIFGEGARAQHVTDEQFDEGLAVLEATLASVAERSHAMSQA